MDGNLDQSADLNMPTSTKKCRRRQKTDTAREGSVDRRADPSMPTSTSKKRRNRGKPDTVLLPAEIAALGVLPSDEKSQKPSNGNGNNSSAGLGFDSLIGQTVHGILDGSFPAGYLITVKIGGTDTLLKGAVFGPGLSMPPPQINNAASKVKHTNTDMNTGFSSQPSSPPPRTPVTLSEVYEPAPIIEPTATSTVMTEVEVASENRHEDLPLPQQHGFLGGENAVNVMLEPVTQDYKPEICDPVAAMQAALYNRVEFVHNYTYTPQQPE